MKNFFDYVRGYGIEVPEHNIPGSWFSEHNYPMIVRCCCCGMTMASPFSWVDDDGYTYCSNCAGE